MITYEDINYHLPRGLIASQPVLKRDEARLLAISKKEKKFTDLIFHEIMNLINPGDCLVFNNTRVFKARLIGKTTSDKNIEILLIERVTKNSWKAMVKNSKKIPAGTKIFFHDVEAEILGYTEGMRIIKFKENITFNKINEIGEVPLPPYIIKKRKNTKEPSYNINDEKRYQSVLARYYGSVAAPTASLHFTEELIKNLESKEIKKAFITLHIGPGTFKPIDAENVDDYKIHKEWMVIPCDTVEILKSTKKSGGRLIAVGTTVARALETMAQFHPGVDEWYPFNGFTDLFIKNGFKFNVVDALITNFHMPRSSLLLLVCSFGGKDLIQEAYSYAIERGYRFLSFGDAMFIY
jgi:S-adenosylmethionine:tRNA ribosyltransferase-isomerase